MPEPREKSFPFACFAWFTVKKSLGQGFGRRRLRLTRGGFWAMLFCWMGAHWFRPEKRAGGGMPRMVRWPRKTPDQK
jgi:hypothetical protein